MGYIVNSKSFFIYLCESFQIVNIWNNVVWIVYWIINIQWYKIQLCKLNTSLSVGFRYQNYLHLNYFIIITFVFNRSLITKWVFFFRFHPLVFVFQIYLRLISTENYFKSHPLLLSELFTRYKNSFLKFSNGIVFSAGEQTSPTNCLYRSHCLHNRTYRMIAQRKK